MTEKMTVNVDFDKITGRIKPMHGVGQPPFNGLDFDMVHYLKEAGVPYSRLHDVGGDFGGGMFVDVPNIFPDFEADAGKEENYVFGFTDRLITALVENGVEPVYRLGVTIENYCEIKAYRIFPPEDNQKWAEICEHIIRHYTEGWANGFRYDVKYWEIWNEPDNYEEVNINQMWRGTKEQYYELYGVASKHLKKCFPNLKIGGYGSCGFYAITNNYVAAANSSPRFDYFIEFFDGFLSYIKEHECPLDFFSWHSYSDLNDNKNMAEYARKRLDDAGYVNTETSCNEWNWGIHLRGTAEHAAMTAAMMLTFQKAPLDSAMFYDARLGVSIYGGLFNPYTRKPLKAYYAFKAFNELYVLQNEVKADSDTELYGVLYAAAEKDGKGCIMFANIHNAPVKITINANRTIKGALVTCETQENVYNEMVGKIIELPAHSVVNVFTDR